MAVGLWELACKASAIDKENCLRRVEAHLALYFLFRGFSQVHDKKMALGLWGLTSIAIDKENCALYYLSPTCYKFIYGTDPVSLYFLRCSEDQMLAI